MRKHSWIVVFSLMIVLIAGGAIAGKAVQMTGPQDASKTHSEQPKAVIPQMEFEFAPVFEGVQVKHDFTIENHGNAPLVIKNVRPG
jgi:uncharacterized membrane protein YebE (DUF533 family)